MKKKFKKIPKFKSEKEERQKVVKEILSLWKKQRGTINYKGLIEDGRKI